MEGETGLVGSTRGDVLLDDALDVIAERDEAHGTPHSERDARGHATEQAADPVLAVDVPRGGEDRRRLDFGRSRGLRGGRGTGEGGGTVRGGRDDAGGGDRGEVDESDCISTRITSSGWFQHPRAPPGVFVRFRQPKRAFLP